MSRLVKRRGDAEAREHRHRELAIRVIDAGGNENVIAGMEQREIDERDRGLAAWREDRVLPFFEFADARGQFERGRSAVEAVGVADFILIPLIGGGCCRAEERRGAPAHCRSERAVAFGYRRVGVNQFRPPGFCHR